VKTTRSRAVAEIAAVAVTGAGKLVVADGLGLPLPFILSACAFWSGYGALRARRDQSQLREWGFTAAGLGPSAARLGPPAVAGAIASAAYGLRTGSLLLHWHILPILLLYPLWRLVQQFLVVALFAANLRRSSGAGEAWTVVVTALVFAAAHVPSPELIVATFAMAAVTTSTYFRVRNLWMLGAFHGWLATLVYFVVLGEDPWLQFVTHGFGR